MNKIQLLVISIVALLVAAVAVFIFFPTEFDWFTWSMGILQGTIVSVVGGTVLLFVIFPKLSIKMGKSTMNAAKADPEIQHLLTSAKEFANAAKPFTDSLKQIQPEDIASMVNALKSMTGTSKEKAILKIPEPLPEA